MDSDNLTPAALYFEDEAFTLVESDGDREVILWLSFYETDASVNFAVYDYFLSKYTHEFKGSTPEDVTAFIAAVEEDYEVKVPAMYVEKVSKFVALKDKSFGFHASLDKESVYCDSCGDTNQNLMEAFYFPPINEGDEASLAVDWRYGCFGGETLAGVPSDKAFVKEVREMMNRAIKSAEVKREANQVKEFLSKLSEVTLARG